MGSRFLGTYLHRLEAGRIRVYGRTRSNFTFRQTCSFFSGSKALGEEVLANYPNVYIWRVRIPFDQLEHPRNYLTKVMRYARLLDATNSISELQEFVQASLLCWELHVPFGTYNMTNPGTVTTREVVDLIKKAGLSDREFIFFDSEDDSCVPRRLPPGPIVS